MNILKIIKKKESFFFNLKKNWKPGKFFKTLVTSDSDQSHDRDHMFYDNIPSGIQQSEPEPRQKTALTRGRGKPLLLLSENPTGNPALNYNAKEFKPRKQQSYGRGGSNRNYNR